MADTSPMADLDWALKTGRITAEEYYKAQSDPQYAATLTGQVNAYNPSADPATAGVRGQAVDHPAQAVDPNAIPVDGDWTSFFNKRLGAPVTGVDLRTANESDSRNRQSALIAQLHDVASGKVTTPAEQLLEQTYVGAQKAAYGTAANTRDIGGGEARRMGQQNSDALGMEASGAQSVLHAQQTQQANELLATLYGNTLAQDTSMANLKAQGALGNRQLADANAQFNVRGGLEAGVADQQYWSALANAKLGYGLDQEDLYGDLLKRGAQAAGGGLSQLGKGSGTANTPTTG